MLLRRTDPVRLVVAGRTDAGVHARGQVAHVDVEPVEWEGVRGRSARSAEDALTARLNGMLPSDVVVRRVRRAPDGFDARFSALRRRYLYRVCDDPAALDPLRRHDTVVVRGPLDVAAMDEAARSLLGLHDFAAFCRRREGATTVRTLLDHRWARADDGTVEGTVVADAFCHSMVRALVGAVVPVGEGRLEADVPRAVLQGGVARPRVRSCRRTGSRSRRSSTRRTPSSPRAPPRPGRAASCPAERLGVVPDFRVGPAWGSIGTVAGGSNPLAASDERCGHGDRMTTTGRAPSPDPDDDAPGPGGDGIGHLRGHRQRGGAVGVERGRRTRWTSRCS